MLSRASFLKMLLALAVITSMTTPPRALLADEKVGIEARFSKTALRAQEQTVLQVTFAIPNGFHLYSMTPIPDGPLPLKLITPPDKGFLPTTDWYGQKPTVMFDPNFNKPVELYDNQVTYARAFRVTATNPGALSLPINIRGQICDDEKCIPFRDTVDASMTVEPGPPRTAYQDTPALRGEAFSKDRTAPTMDDVTEDSHKKDAPPLGDGFLGFILIAFLAGLGALVTPCVFPMIPITVSFFSKFAKVSIKRSVTMASVYAGSIVTTFTLMGVLVSAIFGAVGMQTLSASAGFNIFLTLLLVVFAFNLFGLFEIQMPNWLVAKTSAKERALSTEEGSLWRQAAGVFFMAVTFTLVSFTCTVGFIGVVLAEASKGNWFYPAVGMLAFSLAFSLPFFLLAVFPSIADKLKGKGGDWMVAVKVVLGFLELASAFKFLSNVDLLWQWGVVTRPMVLTVWAALFAGAGLYLLRIFNLPHSDPDTRHVGPIRMMIALLLLALSVYAASGIRDTKSMGGWLDGWLPPAVYPGTETANDADHLDWIVDDLDRGMTEAKAAGKPLFVDFTGYTCTNCRYMEGSVFPKAAVRTRLEKMTRVTAYTDCEKPICESQRDYQLKRFDTAALPFYAIIDPFNDTVLATHPDMSKNINEFVAFLDKGLAAFDAAAKQRAVTAAPADPPSSPTAADPEKTDAGVVEAPTLVNDGPLVDFTLPTLADGTEVHLSDYRGNWVFLNFWASWCAPCKEEIRHVFPVALKAAPHIKLVTVAFDGNDTKSTALAFAKSSGLLSHVTLQGGDDITEAGLPDAFHVSENLPISYLISPEGRIAWQRTGTVDQALLNDLFAKASLISK